MASPTSPEGIIKNQICYWLTMHGVFFWVQQAGKIPGRINRSKYLRNGVSDILGILDSRMLAIEVKSAIGRPTPEQIEFIDNVNKRGGIGFFAYSLNDVINQLGEIIKNARSKRDL